MTDDSNRPEPRSTFGFLRLLFASLVIVAHVPEIVDNDPHRELLHRLTGDMTFGSFAVYGFFVISGYLIAGSLLNTSTLRSYLVKRVARIYPGFIVASVVCLLIVAPLSGAAFQGDIVHRVVAALFRMAILSRPVADHPFAGQHYSDPGSGLNGAMWTIQYEFACYLLLIALGLVGALHRRWTVPLLALILLSIGTLADRSTLLNLANERFFVGAPNQLFVLPGLFLAGTSYHLCRHSLRFSPGLIVGAALAFMASLISPMSAPFGYALFGTYLILAAARGAAGRPLGRVNHHTDLSYGVYLYAWPAEQLLIRYMGTNSLVLLAATTWMIAAVAGWCSWTLVEKPVLEWVKNQRR